MNVTVIRVPKWTRGLIGLLPGWKETSISVGNRIVKHAHRFWAVYFTFGVGLLETASGSRTLPPAAIVIVPRRRIHGWAMSKSASALTGIVGHFHAGHAAHTTEPVTASIS